MILQMCCSQSSVTELKDFNPAATTAAAVQTHRAVPGAEPRLPGMLLSTSMTCLDPTEMLSSSAMCLTHRVVKCMDLPPGKLGIEISNVSETSKYLNLMSLKIKLPSCRA